MKNYRKLAFVLAVLTLILTFPIGGFAESDSISGYFKPALAEAMKKNSAKEWMASDFSRSLAVVLLTMGLADADENTKDLELDFKNMYLGQSESEYISLITNSGNDNVMAIWDPSNSFAMSAMYRITKNSKVEDFDPLCSAIFDKGYYKVSLESIVKTAEALQDALADAASK